MLEAKPSLDILITGASGFVGRAVSKTLLARGHKIRKAVRTASGDPAEVVIGDITGNPNWSSILAGVHTVIHLAARVHQMQKQDDELSEYQRVNRDATQQLALAAAAAGVQRFVFLSSAKVNGEGYKPGTKMPYDENSVVNPRHPYSVSKWKAEQAVSSLGSSAGLGYAIIRPPLVYGAGVKANFLRLLGLVESGMPLPFGLIDNCRSMIYVDNLADFIAFVVEHPAIASETFLVSDGTSVSTKALIQTIAAAMQKSVIMLPVPPGALRLVGTLMSKPEVIERLIDSFEVDSRKAQSFGWQPKYLLADGIERTVQWYRQQKR